MSVCQRNETFVPLVSSRFVYFQQNVAQRLIALVVQRDDRREDFTEENIAENRSFDARVFAFRKEKISHPKLYGRINN